jgi:hypothetical protein
MEPMVRKVLLVKQAQLVKPGLLAQLVKLVRRVQLV